MKKVFAVLLALSVIFAFGANQASAAGSIKGSVLAAADDSPVAGAIVVIQGMDMMRGQRPFQQRLQTADDGSFAADEVPVGKYMITAMARELGGKMVRAEVKDGEETDVVIKLGQADRPEIEFGSLIGTVVDADGNAVEGARIMLTTMAHGRNAHHCRALVAKTNAHGAFSLDKVPAGNWVIMAVAGKAGAARDKVEIVANEQTEINLTLQPVHGRGDHNDDGHHGGGGH